MRDDVQQIADQLRTFTTLDWDRLKDAVEESDLMALAHMAGVDLKEQHDAYEEMLRENEENEAKNITLTKEVARLDEIAKATKWWEIFAFKNKPLIHIGGEQNPYMIRWAIVDGRGKGNNVYLHKFLRDDDDRALHDHPWASTSILLSGSLLEIDRDNPDGKLIEAGQIRTRAADYLHRLKVVEPGYTLFITGPKVREWGFACAEGWRHWTRFSGGEAGEVVGQGCADYSDPITEASPYSEAVAAKRAKRVAA